MKKATGRKTKYTQETIDKLVQAIKLGGTVRIACEYAGIGESTYYDWLNSRQEFSDIIKEAHGQGAVSLLARIQKEAQEGSWQAAAWILERKYPQEYGRRVVTNEHTGAGGGSLEIVVKYEGDGDEQS